MNDANNSINIKLLVGGYNEYVFALNVIDLSRGDVFRMCYYFRCIHMYPALRWSSYLDMDVN